MTIRWNPDTCFCILDVTNGVLTNVVQKCELHKGVDDRILLATVQNMNKFWNSKTPRDPTREQVNQSLKDKRKEKESTRRKS